jgi:hypothetical protein
MVLIFTQVNISRLRSEDAMKMNKKILSLSLVLTIIFSLMANVMPITASALTSGDFEYEVNNSQVEITDYYGEGGAITIPSTLGGYPVTSIDYWAFALTGITSVTIPDSVLSIGVEAFSLCSNLTQINVDSGNASYKSVDGVLFDKAQTTLIQYPGGKTGDSYLIPNSVTSIGDYAFENCSNFTSITIPNSVLNIGYGAFYLCSNLISVTIPNSVLSIGKFAFNNCMSLTDVTIGTGVTSIGGYAFLYCSSLSQMNVDSGNASYKSIDGVLIDKVLSTLIQYPAGKTGASYLIPSSVLSIGHSAFDSCTSLTSVTIPNSVTNISDDAFYGCTSLWSVIIPSSVLSIGDDAFYKCYNLTLYGEKNSYAKQYASENGLAFSEIIVKKGDINGDDKITSFDALMALQSAVGKRTLTDLQKSVADVNNDGKVTSADALKILRFASGIITQL